MAIDADHVEQYDVEHERIGLDDGLAMLKVLMEARPRLIKGMAGLAGRLSFCRPSARFTDLRIGIIIV